MVRLSVVLAFLVFLSAIGCGPGQGEKVDISNACKPESDGKYFEIAGYLSARGSVFCSNIGGGRLECGFDFTDTPGGDRKFGAEVAQGNGANSVEKLESGYKQEDIKIHENSGQVISLNDKVRITGKMSTTPDGSVCFMKVDKIER